MKMKSTPILVGMVALLPLTAPGAALVQNYWDFEGNFNDKVGSANGSAGSEVTTTTGHGGSGTASTYPSTLSGGGAFDSDGYTDIAPTVPSSGTNAFSMSYWFKIADDSSTNPRGIFDFSGNGGDGPQSLYIGSNNSIAFRVDGTTGGGAALYNNGGTGFEDGQWHFVAATYDPSNGIELHVDGFGVDGSNGSTYGTINWDADQYLGAFNVNDSETARGLDGSLDDVAIYSGILSESEITGLANGSLTPDQIPEPSALLLGALSGLALLRRRRD